MINNHRVSSLFTLGFLLISISSFAQRYKPGGVSMINGKGRNLSETYNKIQIGVLLPGTMPARNNLWYSKTRKPDIQGLNDIIPLTFRYAWSSNINTEFIVQGDFESSLYYDAYAVNNVTHHRQFYTLSIGFNYKWWNYKLITLYSGITLGGGYGRYYKAKGDLIPSFPEEVDKENWTYPSAQLTAIGMTWGKKFGGFTELAFGSKGVMSAGVYLKM